MIMIHIYGDEEEVNRFTEYFENRISKNYYVLAEGLERKEKNDDKHYNFSALEVPDFPYCQADWI